MEQRYAELVERIEQGMTTIADADLVRQLLDRQAIRNARFWRIIGYDKEENPVRRWVVFCSKAEIGKQITDIFRKEAAVTSWSIERIEK